MISGMDVWLPNAQATCRQLVSYRLKTTRPDTIVAIGAPLKLHPRNGELRDLLGESLTS